MTFLTLIIAILVVSSGINAIQVGIIQNTSLVMIPSNITMNASSCAECLCAMVMISTGNLSILSLNCFTNNSNSVICELFTAATYLSSYSYRMENNSNSTFYFQQLPSTNQSQTTAVMTVATSEDTTTSAMVCNSSCANQSWTSSLNLLAFWSFDQTFVDKTNTFNLSSIHSPSFTINGYVNQAISLNANANQSLFTSYIPLANTSFTIDAWIYPTGFPNLVHHSIFGLCPVVSNEKCLHLTIRNLTQIYVLYFGFHADNCASNTTIPLNTWMHVGFVFDIITMTKSIYLNGILDTECPSFAPFMATEGNVTIGSAPALMSSSGLNFFQGYIDQLTVSNRVKSACEILDEATLAARFLFNNGSLLVDSGPNSISANASSYSIVAFGHSDEAISFNGSNSSYFQGSGITIFGLATKAYSHSLWIQPQSLSGILVHFSLMPDGLGQWCIPFLGFTANGSLVAQIYKNGSLFVIVPTLLPVSPSWSHVVETWSPANGLRVYINSILVASLSSATAFADIEAAFAYVTLAVTLPAGAPCWSGPIDTNSSFAGAVHDFRIYRRELSTADVCTLYAN